MKKIMITGAVLAWLASVSMAGLLTTITASVNDQQQSVASSGAGTVTPAFVGQVTASAGAGSPITSTNTYVIPFLLPTIPVGQTITNVQFNAFLVSSYTFGTAGANQVFVDVFGGAVRVTSTLVTTDWSASTLLGNNIAQIDKSYTAVNMVKSVALTASFFNNIYANDANAAGKYVFLTLRPDAASLYTSANTTWATANSTTLAKPTLDIYTATIPEPATVGMLGLGALITLLLRRMRS